MAVTWSTHSWWCPPGGDCLHWAPSSVSGRGNSFLFPWLTRFSAEAHVGFGSSLSTMAVAVSMQLRKSQENPVKTAELYLGLIKSTLNGGSCVLITNYQESECDWLIMNITTPPAITGWEHTCNQVIVSYFFLNNNKIWRYEDINCSTCLYKTLDGF